MRHLILRPVLLGLALLGVTLLGLTSCISPYSLEADAAKGFVRVDTVPQGATLQFTDGSDCVTPCRVEVRQPLEMTIGKIGYNAIRTTLTTTRKGRIVYTLEEAAPTINVEQSALPEL